MEDTTRIHEKLDKLDARLDNIEVTQMAISKDLNYHIKRTNLLEEELKPIKSKYEQMVGIGKFFAFGCALAAVIEMVLRFIYRY